MIEFLCGFLSFVLALGVFMLGFYFGRKRQTPAVKADPGGMEKERLREEIERMKQDQAAFRALTSYSADIAYGLADFPKEGIE